MQSVIVKRKIAAKLKLFLNKFTGIQHLSWTQATPTCNFFDNT
jgi:hypothetical protein